VFTQKNAVRRRKTLGGRLILLRKPEAGDGKLTESEMSRAVVVLLRK
jgi:hypothetical protein